LHAIYKKVRCDRASNKMSAASRTPLTKRDVNIVMSNMGDCVFTLRAMSVQLRALTEAIDGWMRWYFWLAVAMYLAGWLDSKFKIFVCLSGSDSG
jgi:hypothetical protein